MGSRADLRRSAILSELARDQEVNVSQLSTRLEVSEVVIRRDLECLERGGLLRRVHGGAVPASPAFPGQFGEQRAPDHLAEKERIARAAVELIAPGDRLILDSGTTVLQLARQISRRAFPPHSLTVVTNSLHIVRELGSCSASDVMLLGGLYLPQYDIVVGPKTVQGIRELRVHRTFIGTKGLTLERGISTDNVLEAEADCTAVEVAAEVILLADSSKIGADSLTPIVPLSKIHKFITDINAPVAFVAALRARGVEVILV